MLITGFKKTLLFVLILVTSILLFTNYDLLSHKNQKLEKTASNVTKSLIQNHTITQQTIPIIPTELPFSSQLLSFTENPHYIPGSLIPTIVHQTSRNRDFSAFLNSIPKDIHILHLVWSDSDIEIFVKHYYPEKYEFFNSLPHPILKADLFRYMVVNEFGGVYSDMDTKMLKPFNNWIRDQSSKDMIELIAGIESDSIGREDWKKWFAREIQFCQWTFASIPHHQILENVISMAFIRLESELYKSLEFNNRVLETTGPGVFSDGMFQYLKKYGLGLMDIASLRNAKRIGKVLVLSITGFSPGLGSLGLSHKNSRDVGDPEALVKHNFQGSWRSN